MENISLYMKIKTIIHEHKLKKPIPFLKEEAQHELYRDSLPVLKERAHPKSYIVLQELDKNEQELNTTKEELRRVTDELRMTKRKVYTVSRELEKVEYGLRRAKYELETTKSELETSKPDSSMDEQEPRTRGGPQSIISVNDAIYRPIRHIHITDDNLSTIVSGINKYYSKLSQFAMHIKEAFKSDDAENTQENLTNFFVPLFQKSESGIVRRLLAEAPGYWTVSCLVQKYIAEKMCEHFFDLPVCHDEDVNDLFLRTEKLLRNSRQMSEEGIHNLRLFMVKATTFKKDGIVYPDRYGRAVEIVTYELVNRLKVIYDIEQCGIRNRIQNLAEVAAELSLRIRGQRDMIVMQNVMFYDPIYKHQVKLLCNGTSEGPERILLGILPVYFSLSFDNDTDTEPDTEHDSEHDGESGTDIKESKRRNTYLEGYRLLCKGSVIYQ